MTFEQLIDDTLQRAVNGEMDNKEYVQGLLAVMDYFIAFKHAGFGDGLKLLKMDPVIKDLFERAIDGEMGSEAFELELISYKGFLIAYGQAGLSLDLLGRVKPYSVLRECVRTGDLASDEDIRQVLSSMNPRRPKRV